MFCEERRSVCTMGNARNWSDLVAVGEMASCSFKSKQCIPATPEVMGTAGGTEDTDGTHAPLASSPPCAPPLVDTFKPAENDIDIDIDIDMDIESDTGTEQDCDELFINADSHSSRASAGIPWHA